MSPSKTNLFVSETVYGGALVGQNGVQPDPAKLTAIVEWQTPQNALNLSSFLGLTSWFRDLIKGYASKEKVLRDLISEVHIPAGSGKATWQCLMRTHQLAD
jgi:hypothetical protein